MKAIKSINLCLLVLYLAGFLSLNAKDYYVSKDGDDANPGTFEKPFLTIQKAADVMIVGDVCYIWGDNMKKR